jgi:hypothetical protein
MIRQTLRNNAYITLALMGVLVSSFQLAAQQTSLLENDAADELTKLIDRRIADGWERNKIEPAPQADDSEFLRRTYLNIIGRIPSVYEVLEFFDDTSANKRHELIERLLASPGYLSNFTAVWRDVIVPEASSTANPFDQFGDVSQFESWLRERLDRNDGFDRIAREVITGTTEVRSEGTTTAFERLKEAKPENLAAGTSRAFLGVRLECAQCHNHPFAKWKREDFWKLAAFYGGGSSDNNRLAGPGGKKIKIPDTDKEVEAAFLNAVEPNFSNNKSPRAILASWVTSNENSYFARATVNRLWGHFFGIGIVEPVDDFDERNPASHPELLDDLARAFVASNYDLKFMIRAITRSRPYQLASRRNHPSQQEPRHYARMLVKGLTSDQLFDSLIWATGNAEDQQNRRGFVIPNGQRQQFRELFGQQTSSPGEVQTSILQALLMLNGDFVDQASSPQQSMTLSAIIAAPFFSNQERIETLFLAALARQPRSDEVSMFLKYFEGQSSEQDSKEALGDIYWALLNSSEFSLNH